VPLASQGHALHPRRIALPHSIQSRLTQSDRRERNAYSEAKSRWRKTLTRCHVSPRFALEQVIEKTANLGFECGSSSMIGHSAYAIYSGLELSLPCKDGK
jgi:hypothetical protein